VKFKWVRFPPFPQATLSEATCLFELAAGRSPGIFSTQSGSIYSDVMVCRVNPSAWRQTFYWTDHTSTVGFQKDLRNPYIQVQEDLKMEKLELSTATHPQPRRTRELPKWGLFFFLTCIGLPWYMNRGQGSRWLPFVNSSLKADDFSWSQASQWPFPLFTPDANISRSNLRKVLFIHPVLAPINAHA
jgi:hypothetical protein